MLSLSSLEFARPVRGTPKSAGIDIPFSQTRMLMPKEKKKIDLHVRAKIPPGHFGLLKLRSSVSLDHDIQICGGIIGTY